MTEGDLLKLKNGSDIRGTALGGKEVDLTEEAAGKIASAFLVFVTAKTGKAHPVIAIGHDSRLTADALTAAAARGIARCGGDVILTGLSSTPSMYMLLKDGFGADASVMITASHLPKEKNGLKFFLPEGGLEGNDISDLLRIAALDVFPEGEGKVTEKRYLEQYAQGLVRMVRKATGKEAPLTGKRILVDAGNGAGGFYADLVLKPLGADTVGSQFLDPDGIFPHHIPNPENEEAMRSISEAVKTHHADLGIIFDTDVDRAGAVGPDGEEINRNRLIALISAILLEEHPGACIVTDSVTSDGLSEFIARRGGVHHRFKRGYKNVINESKRLREEGVDSPLAIETSGHAAFAENYDLDDGAYLVTRLLVALAQKGDLMSLIADLPEPLEAQEVRLRFADGSDFRSIGARIIRDLGAYAISHPHVSLAPENYEGVRINFDRTNGNGWMLVRMSLHEPILPINVESNSPGGNRRMLSELLTFLKTYPLLDIKPLEMLLKNA